MSNLPVVPETPADTDAEKQGEALEENGEAPESGVPEESLSPSESPRDGESEAEEEVARESDGYDTDLEVQERRRSFDSTGRRIYLDICERLGVVPASFFLRNIQEPEVIMPHHGLGPLGAKAIAFPLITNTKILTLDLSDNWLGDDGATHLCEMLKENCYISTLNLSDNRIGFKGASAICDMLEQNVTITDLNLSGNEFTDSIANKLANALLENKSLSSLDLSRNQFGDGSGAILGYAIGENETLESINLSWNHFRRKSGADVVDGVKVNSRLKVVDLSWNGLGRGAEASLSECFKQNEILRELDISSNRITAEDATVLARGLPFNESLVVLKVGLNPLGPSGAMTLMKAIDNERSILEQLDLSGVVVDKAFVAYHNDLKERRDVTITYSGVFSDYVLKATGRRRPGGSAQGDDPGALEGLEEWLRALVLPVQAHVQGDYSGVEEVFYSLDKGQEHRLQPQELKKALMQLNVPELTEDVIDNHLQMASTDEDGKINYSHFLKKDIQEAKE